MEKDELNPFYVEFQILFWKIVSIQREIHNTFRLISWIRYV